MFEKVVVGLDCSLASEHALRLACDLAKMYTSEIHLVHTPQPQTATFALGAAAGYYAATTMLFPEGVDKIANSAKAMSNKTI